MSIARTAKLGTSQVPALCIGTWSWGDSKQWKYEPEKHLPEIKEAWESCLAVGCSFFDTAEVYGMGESEKIIGKLISETPAEQRKNVVIATKWLPFPNPMNWSLFSPGIVSSLKGSLKRMGLDSVELFQIHSNTSYFSYDSQARELAKCIELGLAKQVGVSNYSKEQIIKMSAACEKYGIKLASNQIEFNLARTISLNNGLLEEMSKRGIQCLAYSPLAMGRLTGKYSVSNPPPGNRRFSNIPMEQLEPLLNVMRKIAKSHDVPVSAVALGWVMAKGAIPLGGARNKQQAEQNAKALTLDMSAEDIAELDGSALEGKNSFWQQG